jgi:hypothetical protein
MPRAQRDIKRQVAPGDGEDFVGDLLMMRGRQSCRRTKPIRPFAALDALDEARDVLTSRSRQHPQHRLVGARQRAVERRRGAGHRGVGVGVRAADDPHRGGAAVLLVVRVQDEQHVHRPLEHRVDLVLQLRHPEQHVQEVAV